MVLNRLLATQSLACLGQAASPLSIYNEQRCGRDKLYKKKFLLLSYQT